MVFFSKIILLLFTLFMILLAFITLSMGNNISVNIYVLDKYDNIVGTTLSDIIWYFFPLLYYSKSMFPLY